ncbi:hypothetical protein A3C17_01920 [Candidatus Uhrbacteria bacterium RIFCSPHIGHO2_02_FULL_53_13]|uniref:Uncharacterized protein n=2 Tax=Candidatus Uhriibacteriota TaxID=1752732 RepID=A0A1F7U1Z7_9BACT|nr:MAG: hypothetical protein A3C17_01920 [Candidatus Uhrbacteria bacterium RIFCSPHIGHO2_02_FULL_53_13]OGL88842.1 MAG: hypothetical protein A3I45_02955 [Candidatus Uhrbacteria bacterium RIFCSPLOWO2_02_FULL_53_10]
MEQNLKKVCPECFSKLKELQKLCQGCGYKIELVTADEEIERFLRRPSPGGLLWTQAYAFGTRQYLWFVLSILPITGFVALPMMFAFGRRWSWRVGGWGSFTEFKERQVLMDRIGIAWILFLVLIYLYFRFRG